MFFNTYQNIAVNYLYNLVGIPVIVTAKLVETFIIIRVDRLVDEVMHLLIYLYIK